MKYLKPSPLRATTLCLHKRFAHYVRLWYSSNSRPSLHHSCACKNDSRVAVLVLLSGYACGVTGSPGCSPASGGAGGGLNFFPEGLRRASRRRGTAHERPLALLPGEHRKAWSCITWRVRGRIRSADEFVGRGGSVEREP